VSESEGWKGHIRALIYPIQFENDALDGVERVIASVVHKKALGTDERGYRESIDYALTSNVRLSELIPQHHSEDVIRKFLSCIREKLDNPRKEAPTPEGWVPRP
jgi:hypothetical protein